MPKRTWQDAVIAPNAAQRIQNAANRTGQTIYVVGSRARGTAHMHSDWDYILTGNAKQRSSAKSSLPGWMTEDAAAQMNLGHGVTNTGRGIDIFQNYSPFDDLGRFVDLDVTRPYVEFVPVAQGPLGPLRNFAPASQQGGARSGLQYKNSRVGGNGSVAFDIDP